MEESEILVSFIVPVYNVKTYLDQCINSIVNQTYKNIEIILVDDGSTDGSGKICDKWEKEDNRIRVIHIPNGGLGNARNVGTKLSGGEYIMYVDSDDWIEIQTCEVMISRIRKRLCNACMCAYRQVYDEKIIEIRSDCIEVCSGQELLSRMLNRETLFSYSVWKFMFKRKDILGLSFDTEVYYEDVTFMTKYLLRNPEVAVEPQILYNYRIRNNSITSRRITSKHVRDFITTRYNQTQCLKQYGYPGNISEYYWMSLLDLKYCVYRNGKDKNQLLAIKKALSRIPLDTRGIDLKTRVTMALLLYAMPLYYLSRIPHFIESRFLASGVGS